MLRIYHSLITMSTISLALLSFLSQYLLILSAQPDFLFHTCYNDKGNYTNPSAYHTNLNTLLSHFTSDPDINYGFYNSYEGLKPDIVNAIGLCRGDVKLDTCRSCLGNATTLLPKLCPNQKEAIGFYELCMFRYSNRSLYRIFQDTDDNDFANILVNLQNATDAEKHMVALAGLMQNLTEEAAAGGSHLKVAAGRNATADQSEIVYGLVQCTPDLSETDCRDCLERAISFIPSCCGNRIGARVINPSCNIRYENYRFFDPMGFSPQAPPTSPPPSTTGGKDSSGSQTLVKIIVPVIIFSATLFCLVGCYLLRRKTRKRSQAILRENFGEESSNLKSLQFSLATIEAATKKFSQENTIGKGGFGEVYKGILLDGQEIAVKRLSKNSVQGSLEFKNEILLIAKLQHKNLVTLLGFCLEEEEKILVYEYVPNKSIDYFLFDSEKQRLLNWPQRFKIIGGIAQGLSYLHEHSRLKVIHRDIKPSNILLDNKMNPKISDFGMARMIAIDEDQKSTNRIVGTYGYMAPEYLIHGQFSEKSDVFSFGVIVLEAISSKRNSRSYESYLLTNVWKQWNDGTPLQVLDPFLVESCSQIEVIKCVQIGLLCVQQNPDDRPTMAQVVSYLSNLSIELPSPREPAFFMHSNPTMVAQSGLDQTSQSSKTTVSNEMSKSELLPR